MPNRPAPEFPVSQPRQPEYSPQAAAPSAVEVSAAAIERLRSSIPRTERPRVEPSEVADIEGVPLSPNGAAPYRAPQPRPPVAEPPPEPTTVAEDRTGGAAEALKASRLDFLFRSRPTRPASSDTFDAMWPKRNGRVVAEPSRVEKVESIEREDSGAVATITIEPPVEERRPPPMVEERRPTQRVSALPDRGPSQTEESRPMVAILKSGVVDGMAYTLYADGSIEAQLPQGTVRFGSIAELRAHIENNS